MTSRPHEPARKVGGTVPDKDLQPESESYPDIPTDEPGLVGGPATTSVPGATALPVNPDPQRRHQEALTNPLPGEAADGGESILEGRPRETGGVRPPKQIPKTEGS